MAGRGGPDPPRPLDSSGRARSSLGIFTVADRGWKCRRRSVVRALGRGLDRPLAGRRAGHVENGPVLCLVCAGRTFGSMWAVLTSASGCEMASSLTDPAFATSPGPRIYSKCLPSVRRVKVRQVVPAARGAQLLPNSGADAVCRGWGRLAPSLADRYGIRLTRPRLGSERRHGPTYQSSGCYLASRRAYVWSLGRTSRPNTSIQRAWSRPTLWRYTWPKPMSRNFWM